jgi:hypothetical protein
MAEGRPDNSSVRTAGRPAARDGPHAGSAARINDRLTEQLCQLGREVVHEPVPQHLIEIVQAREARRRRR